MQYNKFIKTNIALGLVLVFVMNFAAMCGKNESRTRTVAKATDDFAMGQQSVARLLANARDTGVISQEDVNEIKPFLQQANDLNKHAIEYGNKLLNSPQDTEVQRNLVDTINQISAVLVRANNAGFLRIKNKETQAAFSALIVTMQAAVTSVALLLPKNKE